MTKKGTGPILSLGCDEMKKKSDRIEFFLKLVLGLGCLLFIYPFIGEKVNKWQVEKAMKIMEENQLGSDQARLDRIRSYNDYLLLDQLEKIRKFDDLKSDEAAYYRDLEREPSLLGYLEIEAIRERLEVYAGLDEETLNSGVGHIPGTSLPFPGTSVKSVLTSHTGAIGRRLFSRLDRLKKGDRIYFTSPDYKLVYEVDRIDVVTSGDFTKTLIEEGKNYLSLITCTPKGVNSHRLIVRAKLIEEKIN